MLYGIRRHQAPAGLGQRVKSEAVDAVSQTGSRRPASQICAGMDLVIVRIATVLNQGDFWRINVSFALSLPGRRHQSEHSGRIGHR